MVQCSSSHGQNRLEKGCIRVPPICYKYLSRANLAAYFLISDSNRGYFSDLAWKSIGQRRDIKHIACYFSRWNSWTPLDQFHGFIFFITQHFIPYTCGYWRGICIHMNKLNSILTFLSQIYVCSERSIVSNNRAAWHILEQKSLNK